MLGVNVFAADTDEEARCLFTSLQQAFVNLRAAGPGRLPPPVRDFEEVLSGPARAAARAGAGVLRDRRRRTRCAAACTRSSRAPGADELMISGEIFDHAARLRSYEIAAQVA